MKLNAELDLFMVFNSVPPDVADTLVNNFGIEIYLTKYLKENCIVVINFLHQIFSSQSFCLHDLIKIVRLVLAAVSIDGLSCVIYIHL